MYALTMTIDYYYWEQDCKCHYARQIEKVALKSHSQKQGKTSTFGTATVSQNKANTSLAALSAKTLPSSYLCPPLPRNNLILCRWTFFPSWPAMAS